jgi:DNA-binding CsgD family transcriptional regulator
MSNKLGVDLLERIRNLTLEHMFYYNPNMDIWHWILYRLHVRSLPGPRHYELVENLQLTLRSLAEQQGRSEEDLAADLMARGLSQYYSSAQLWQAWETLSPRERDVVALTCLGSTNRQIAFQLGVSPETVKSHVRNVLAKFQLHSKVELRLVLAGWDFSWWLGDK